MAHHAGDQQADFLEGAADLFPVSEQDIIRGPMHADLAFGFDRAGADIALLEPELLGEEDLLGKV